MRLADLLRERLEIEIKMPRRMGAHRHSSAVSGFDFSGGLELNNTINELSSVSETLGLAAEQAGEESPRIVAFVGLLTAFLVMMSF